MENERGRAGSKTTSAGTTSARSCAASRCRACWRSSSACCTASSTACTSATFPGVGELALAGVGVCGPVVTMIGSVASLVGVGGAPLMSIRMGEGDERGARAILANCFLMICLFAVALMAVVIPLRRADADAVRRERGHAALRRRVLSSIT